MEDVTFELASGRVAGRRVGREDAPLVVCVHGLTANMTAFAWLAEGLVREGRQVLAIDCRGRGRSEVTAPGSYGLAAHARDVIELAGQVGATEIDYVGWSMGALIGICLAQQAPELIDRLVLVDHVGPMEPAAVALVEASLMRLDAVVSTTAQYTGAIRSRGVIDPWTPFWEDHYAYELERGEDGLLRPSTSRTACAEDLADAGLDWKEGWSHLTMPTTLVWAKELIAGTRIVADAACAAIASTVPNLRVVETATNHYTVMTDPVMLAAVSHALRR